MKSTLRLFKAVPVAFKEAGMGSRSLMTQTLNKGFVLSPTLWGPGYKGNFSNLITQVEELYGKDAVALNQSFHKSWEKVRSASRDQLAIEQIIHYLSTYGAEAAGFYDQDNIFVPGEVLAVPELKDGIRLTVIHGMTKGELRAKFLELVESGIAFSEETVADILDVATYVGFRDPDDLERVKNREVKAALYEYFGLVPHDSVEFLRYVVYKATGQTLLIKSPQQIAAIKASSVISVDRAFDIYVSTYGPENLSRIFHRFKPIFLAFRYNAHMKQIINRIGRMADAYHRPMAEDRLNTVTARLAHHQGVLVPEFYRSLAGANVFRKARLAYALRFRMGDPEAVVYRIRNGKTWTQPLASSDKYENREDIAQVFDEVISSIQHSIAKNVDGKSIYIPDGVIYGLPSTERQFVGNVPAGTRVSVGKHMVCGIHWTDVNHARIDLDLSLRSATQKIGWDADYRNSGGTILYSGDMTAAPAPLGAAEYFYVDERARGTYLLSVNYYNFAADLPVPFQIVVAKQKPPYPQRHYMVDPNRIVAQASVTMDVPQKNLGIVVAKEGENFFIFAEFNQGKGRSSRVSATADLSKRFLLDYYTNAISLNALLVGAGAKMVEDPASADIDLSLEAIDKNSIISLLT